MSQELLNISVTIAGRSYRMKVSKDEETSVRKAAKALNDKMLEYQAAYSAKDSQDYLAMAALLFTTEFLKNEKQSSSSSLALDSLLNQLDQELQQLESQL